MWYLSQMENELFEVKINEKGIRLLWRLNFWTKFFYGCCIATSIFDLLNAMLSLRSFLKYSDATIPFLRFQYIFNIVFLILYAILLPLQAWFFYRFSSQSTRASHLGSTEEFNDSFQWLIRHAIFATVLFIFNTIWVMGIAFVQIRWTVY